MSIAIKQPKIYFSYEVAQDNPKDVKFFVNSAVRPNTHLGTSQGDHISAYALVLEGMQSSLTQENMRNIANQL